MDPGERRRPPAASPRLKAILAANVVAVLVLVRLLVGGDAPVAAGEPPADARPVFAFEEPPRALDPGVAPESGAVPGAGAVEADPAAPVAEDRETPGGGAEPASAARGALAPSSPALVPDPASRPPPVTRDRALEERLRARIGAAIAEGGRLTDRKVSNASATVAVCVRRLGRPGALVALNADRAMRPASNMKLVTTAAALVLLGADATLETRFEAGGAVRHGALEGDLVVRAGGDPLFDPAADGRVAHRLAPLAAALRAADVRRVTGDLVLDEGGFAPPAPGPAWPSEDQHWQEHCALAGGFSANAGCLTAVVSATEVGQPARAALHPLFHGLPRRGSVRTAAKGPLDVRVGVVGGEAVLDGTVPAGVEQWTARFAHPDPVELFGSVLAAALREGGVELAGEVVRARRDGPYRELAVLRTPVVELIGPINTDSNNAVADQLFLATGLLVLGEPTRAGGARATRRALERLGVSTEGLVQVDGSGLSRDDRVTARQLAALLDAVLSRGDETSRAFEASLAVGGETGTLADRLQDPLARGRVLAKTGFIGGTSALSGVLTAESGERLVFSILVEYPRLGGLNTSCWKPMQDDLVLELIRRG